MDVNRPILFLNEIFPLQTFNDLIDDFYVVAEFWLFVTYIINHDYYAFINLEVVF